VAAEILFADALIAARGIHFASTAMLSGVLWFGLFVAEPALRASPHHFTWSATLRTRVLAIAWISLGLGLASGAAWFVLVARNIAGHSWAVLTSERVGWTLLTDTRFGNDWLIRLALGAALATCLLGRSGWPARWQGPAEAVIAAGLIGSLAWAGHGGAGAGADGAIEAAADALHLVAAGGWIGGLAGLATLLGLARQANDEPSFAIAARATSRFSLLGVVSVCVLLATGIVNSLFLVGSVPALMDTDYGRLLMIKIGLFAIMVAIASVNRFGLLPRFCGAERSSALVRVQHNSRVELLLAFIIVLVVGVLGTMSPAAHAHHSGATWYPRLPSVAHARGS
jgi:copper resistance protein D